MKPKFCSPSEVARGSNENTQYLFPGFHMRIGCSVWAWDLLKVPWAYLESVPGRGHLVIGRVGDGIEQ